MSMFLMLCLYGLWLQSASVIAEKITYKRLDDFSGVSANRRKLRAASSAVDFLKRDLRIPIQYDLTLDYFEGVYGLELTKSLTLMQPRCLHGH